MSERTEEEFYESYANGEVTFVEVESEFYSNLVSLEESYFSICMLFSETVRVAPTKMAKKQAKNFSDMFENVLKNCNLYDSYLYWKEQNPDYESVLKGTVYSNERK